MMQPDTRQIYQKSDYRIIILQFYNCPIELKTPEPNAPMESSILLSLDNFATTNKRLNVILVTESYMYFENDYHMISQMTADIFPSRESLFFIIFFFFQNKKSRKTEFLVNVSCISTGENFLRNGFSFESVI